jgi:Icc-related predicted phosphoesterase
MATSDLHGNLLGLDPRGADVVVIAGDIAPLRGRGPWHINDQRKWINKRFREWIESYPDIQFVVIPGNHDFFTIAHLLFADHGIDWKYDFPPNVHFLCDTGIEKRPRTVFCGHIHTGLHGGVDFEGSRIYNVSRLDENYEIAYEPTWLEI